MDAEFWTEVQAAHRQLRDAQAEGNAETATDAWNRLSTLIETGPPASALDSLPEIGDDDDLSVADQRKEVLKALFDAATSGNPTAILKWLDLHRGHFDQPESPEPDEGGPVDHSDTIKALEDAFIEKS